MSTASTLGQAFTGSFFNTRVLPFTLQCLLISLECVPLNPELKAQAGQESLDPAPGYELKGSSLTADTQK